MGGDGQPHEREIVVGMNNDKLLEVKEGLREGERVVLNPAPLISDKAEMKPGTPQERQQSEGGSGMGKGGKKKNGKGPAGGNGKTGGGLPPGLSKEQAQQMFNNASAEQKKAWMEKMKNKGGQP
jgi:hypothetical protein